MVLIRASSLFLAALLLCAGCGVRPAHMEHPESPQGIYREQISAAQRLLEQKESWADRAEWDVEKTDSGWKVTAWRVEHPELKGANRYLPWGYSVIDLDSRSLPVGYHKKG